MSNNFLLRDYIWDDMKLSLNAAEKADINKALMNVIDRPMAYELDLDLLPQRLQDKVLKLNEDLVFKYRTKNYVRIAKAKAEGKLRGYQ
jgi:hypothetical protein